MKTSKISKFTSTHASATRNSTKEPDTIGASTDSSNGSRIRAPALCSSIEPSRFARRGIPEYIGCGSLRSVFTADTTCTTTTAPIDGSNRSCRDEQDAFTAANEEGFHVRQSSALPLHEKKRDGSSASEDLKKESSHHWVWKIQTSLPSVPQHAPLEHASLQILDLPLDTITARISNFLRVNSISSCYPTEEPGRVDCLTCNCIKFVIQLWKDEEGYMVEVQRRRGCCIRMKFLRNCLYKTIFSGQCPCQNCCKIQFRHLSKGLEQKICNELSSKEQFAEDQEHSKRRRASHGQFACLNLLESEKADEKRLGIECMLGMTDPKNEPSLVIARALIYNEEAISFRLRHCFLDLLSAKFPMTDADGDLSKDASVGTGRTTPSSDDASAFEIHAPQNTEVGDTHVLALTVLVNCLELIEAHEHDYLTNEITKLQLWTPFWCRVLDILVYNLHESSSQPLEAALSTKCIRILENFEPERLSPFIGSVVAPLLKPAHEFGKAHHRSLEKESEDLVLRYCSDEPRTSVESDAESSSSSSS